MDASPDSECQLNLCNNEENQINLKSLSGKSSISELSSKGSYIIEYVEEPCMIIDKKDSSSEESIEFEQIQLYIDGILIMPTPFDDIFFNRNVVRISNLIEEIEKETFSNKKDCFFSIFNCITCGKNSQLKKSKKNIKNFGKSVFDKNNTLHGNLIMSWYFSYTGKYVFKPEAKIWHKLGFSSEDPYSNGLYLSGVPFVLLHLLYFKEKAVESMQKYHQACLNPNTTGCMISISAKILELSLKLFDCSSFDKIFSNSDEKPLTVFFNFHSGIVVLWCQAFEEALDKDRIPKILQNTRKKAENFAEVINLFKSKCQ